DAPNGLALELATATVAVVAGGITLYEAAALGTPVVAVAVTPEQRHTIRAFAHEGAVLDAGAADAGESTFDRVVARVTSLLTGELDSAWLARRARSLVDA